MNNFYSGEGKKPLYRIGIDFDLTLVDSLTPWLNWFNAMVESYKLSNHKKFNNKTAWEFQPVTHECCANFKDNFAILMGQRLGEFQHIVDPMEYWRNPNLYNNMQPIKGAVEFFTKLKLLLENKGYQVEMVCVTKCEPEHERSKRQFVIDNFKDLIEGFISTNEKHMVAIDCLFDDSINYVIPCIQNRIIQVYLNQSNNMVLNVPDSDYHEVIHVVKDPTGQKNHFDVMLDNIENIVDVLDTHYDYVR